MNEERWFGLIFVMVLLTVPIVGILDWAIVTDREAAREAAVTICADAGYVRELVYKDVFYCITYGLEPTVQRAGSVAELRGD